MKTLIFSLLTLSLISSCASIKPAKDNKEEVPRKTLRIIFKGDKNP